MIGIECHHYQCDTNEHLYYKPNVIDDFPLMKLPSGGWLLLSSVKLCI